MQLVQGRETAVTSSVTCFFNDHALDWFPSLIKLHSRYADKLLKWENQSRPRLPKKKWNKYSILVRPDDTSSIVRASVLRASCLWQWQIFWNWNRKWTQSTWELSGRELDSRPRGRGFKPHRRHCVVSWSKNINPSLVLVQPRKTRPFITERLLMGRKKSNQTNKHKVHISRDLGVAHSK